jgi:hypothetical protein
MVQVVTPAVRVVLEQATRLSLGSATFQAIAPAGTPDPGLAASTVVVKIKPVPTTWFDALSDTAIEVPSLEAVFYFLPALRSERCYTTPVPLVVDSWCFGNANPAPRRTLEEPFATRTSLERGRALGRNRRVLVEGPASRR